ncbi:uncharacterized protein LOC111321932 [Stylophora pistillata]|nr:uncharacterized protein LOC111321932 [Stylophora pistillata]
MFVVREGEILKSRFSKGTKAGKQQLQRGEYLVRNVFERHKKYKDFNRTSTVITKWNGHELPLGLIQFTFAADEHHISCHKHPCSGKQFIPTAPSTKVKMFKEATEQKGPSRIFDELSEAAGGILHCEQSADLPRDSKQVINVRHRAQNKASRKEFATLLDLAKDHKDVHNLQWMPLPRVVYFMDEQLDDNLQECCRPKSMSILSIDTTFNVGDFYMTTTTYQSEKVVSKKTGKAANLPGPEMFHTTKTQRDYLYFTHTLLESNYNLEKVAFLGGDRDKAQSFLLKPSKGCTFIPCTKHVQDDIMRKIGELGLSSAKSEILQDTFRDERRKEKGIINSGTAYEFMAKVESVSNKWDKMEEDITGKSPQYVRYFQRNIQDNMKNGMLLPVRRQAGLNDEFFYSNAQESSNFVYKSKILEKKVVEGTGYRPDPKCTWAEAISVYRALVEQSRRDIQHAVLGKGPYNLSLLHQHLAVSATSWSGKTRKERELHLAKLGTSIAVETEEENREEPMEKQDVISSFVDSGLPELLKGSWTNTNSIIQLDGIGSFPNENTRRVVISLTRPISHTVQITEKKLACLECPQYDKCGICAHTLAVAHHLGMLSDYVKSYQVPLARIVGAMIPSGAGKDNKRKNIHKQTVKPSRHVSQY